MKFRALEAEEIECRVGQISQNGKGLSLLLYKDARADMNILDETLGTEGWQCEYSLINNQLFCTVLVWSDKHQQWIAKQDVGTASNMEAEKGRASDAFKRACVKLGIGRELYTAPRIWVYPDKCEITSYNGKLRCNDTFRVAKVLIEDGRINGIRIVNEKSGKVVFSWKRG